METDTTDNMQLLHIQNSNLIWVHKPNFIRKFDSGTNQISKTQIRPKLGS